MTALAVWLGVIVHRAREQREAVEAIVALRGIVTYDWHGPPGSRLASSGPPGPIWLRRIVGDEFFQHVSQVDFGSPIAPTRIELSRAIPCLTRLRTLKRICVFASDDSQRQDELAAALPHCELELFYVDNSPSPMPVQMFNR